MSLGKHNVQNSPLGEVSYIAGQVPLCFHTLNALWTLFNIHNSYSVTACITAIKTHWYKICYEWKVYEGILKLYYEHLSKYCVIQLRFQ